MASKDGHSRESIKHITSLVAFQRMVFLLKPIVNSKFEIWCVLDKACSPFTVNPQVSREGSFKGTSCPVESLNGPPEPQTRDSVELRNTVPSLP